MGPLVLRSLALVFLSSGCSNGDAAHPPDLGTSNEPTLVATANLSAMTVDAANLYWIDRVPPPPASQDAGIWKIALGGTGSTPVKLASVTGPAGAIAVDATFIYFSYGIQSAHVAKVPIAGGAVVPLADFAGAAAVGGSMVVSASAVYATTGGSVVGIPLDGSAVKEFAANQANAQGIAANAEAVFWAVHGLPPGGTGSIMSAPLAGGTAVQVAGAQNFPYAIVLDDQSVYWTNEGTFPALDDGAIVKAPLGGGGMPATELATGQKGLSTALVLRDGWLYYTTSDSIVKVAAAGGLPTTMLAGQSDLVRSIAVDATHLYFARSGAIYRMRR